MTKSIRLTNQVREKILADLMAAAYDKKLKAISDRRYALSVKVYNDVYSKAQRDAMLALPSGWLPKVKSIQVQFGGSSSDVCKREFPEGEEVPVPYKDKNSWGSTNILKVYDHDHKLTLEHDAVTDDIKALNSEMEASQAEASAVLYSANTTKALKESWPEIADIVAKYEPSEGSQNGTSIIRVTQGLNEKLGLKPCTR